MPNHLYFDFWQSVKKDCIDREAELLAIAEPHY